MHAKEQLRAAALATVALQFWQLKREEGCGEQITFRAAVATQDQIFQSLPAKGENPDMLYAPRFVL